MQNFKIGTRSVGDTADNVIHTGRCLLHGVYPELASLAGTVTIRNGAAAGGTIVHLAAIGVLAAGKSFGGVLFDKGLTVQLSAGSASERALIVWEAV